MKIKNLILYYPSFESGGVEKIIKILVSNLKKKNIKIFFVTFSRKKVNFLKKYNKNIQIICPKKKRFTFLSDRLFTSINCIQPLIKVITTNDKKCSLIHSMQSSYFSILIAKIFSIKIVIRNSENPIESLKYAENKLLSYIIFFLRFFFYNLTDLIITNSKGSAKSLETFVLNKKKIKFIYNPYFTEDLIKSSIKVFEKKKIIMSAGRLTKQKNHTLLINAFNKTQLAKKGFVLNIFGRGYLKKSLTNQIKKLNLTKSVFLKGNINNIKNEYKKSKIFVLPSVYEGLGNVLIEALAFNVHCIATSCKSGPEEILCYGKGGLIVPINNVQLMSKAILKNIQKFKKQHKKMLYAKKRLNRFNYQNQCNKYIKTLNSVL